GRLFTVRASIGISYRCVEGLHRDGSSFRPSRLIGSTMTELGALLRGNKPTSRLGSSLIGPFINKVSRCRQTRQVELPNFRKSIFTQMLDNFFVNACQMSSPYIALVEIRFEGPQRLVYRVVSDS